MCGKGTSKCKGPEQGASWHFQEGRVTGEDSEGLSLGEREQRPEMGTCRVECRC